MTKMLVVCCDGTWNTPDQQGRPTNVTKMTRAILRGYDLTEPDQTHAVRLLGSVFHGYISLESAGGFSHTSVDTQESWSWVLDSLDALLRGRGAPAP